METLRWWWAAVSVGALGLVCVLFPLIVLAQFDRLKK